MSVADAEHVFKSLTHLKIDDSRVNKMIRRRSTRIQQKKERHTLDFSFDLENNNWFSSVRDSENAKDYSQCKATLSRKSKQASKIEAEFELEHENVHYQHAVKQFEYITRSEYWVRRSKNEFEDDVGGDCGCVPTADQVRLGKLGCIEDCLNNEMSIECDETCKLGNLCGNQRIRKSQNSPCTVFITEKKGYGLFASKDIPKGTFIMEFVGEVVSMSEFKKRSREYAKQKTRHCYVMTSAGKRLIDATKKGSLTRFVNHSCNPNAETQKWTVSGECRIGIFSKKQIKMFDEITINYQFERFGKDAQECYCDSSNCRGFIGS